MLSGRLSACVPYDLPPIAHDGPTKAALSDWQFKI